MGIADHKTLRFQRRYGLHTSQDLGADICRHGAAIDGEQHGRPVTVIVADGQSFNGGDYFNLYNRAAMQITGDQTIEMWLKPTNFAERRNPYAKS